MSHSPTAGPAQQRATVTLCAIVKDEERYVPEWLAYHRALGFDEIVLIDNDSGEPGRSQLLALEAAGLIRRLTWKTHPGIHNQHLAYLKALRSTRTDWIAFLDIDEFLVLKEDADVAAFLRRFGPDVSLVQLNWRIFGTAGHRHYSPEPSFLRFPYAAPADHGVNRHLKYFVRTAAAIEPYVHSAAIHGGRTVNGSGEDIAVADYCQAPIDHRVAQVNHYVLRSQDEFEAKLERGRLSQATGGAPPMPVEEAERYRDLHDQNVEPDLSAFAMLDRYAAARAEVDASLAESAQLWGAAAARALWVGDATPEPVFAAGAIEVFQSLPAPPSAPLVVTFSHWFPRGAKVSAFAQDMLAQRRINAIHVVNQRADWFLGRDAGDAVAAMLDAIAALPVMQTARLRIGYGSSMGGYAALRFRDMLNLKRVIAFAPQFSIDSTRVPFETRWREEAAECDFAQDRLRVIAPGEDVTLVYDPRLPMDRAHVALIDPHRRAAHVAIPYSGHPPLTFFAQAGVLPELVERLLRGEAIGDLLCQAHARRKQSALFWQIIAEDVVRRGKNPAWALRAADRGLSLAPDDVELGKLRGAVARMVAAAPAR